MVFGMAPFLYRCPNTGQHVQGWSAEEVSANQADTYETVQQAHLVSPLTGKVLTGNDNQ